MEWGVCLGATVAAVSLHLIFLTHAGGLWRDEAITANQSAMSFSELWQKLTLDSSPLFTPLALRGWSALAGGHSDFVFRAYGFVVGIALLGALWFNAWAMGRQLPLLSLGLLAVNATVVRWGDTVRAYGSSLVFMLVMLGLVWRLAVKPDGCRFALAAVAAVLSVQAQFQNAALLLAMCGAGCLVCLRRRDWRTAGLVVSVRLVAALTLVPYVPNILHSQEWWALQKSGFLPGWVWSTVLNAIGVPCWWLAIPWLGLVLLAVGAGIGAARHADWPDSELRLFAASALVLGLGCFLVFLWVAGLRTQVWYYLPPMTLSAACINAALPTKLGEVRALRLAVVGLMILLPYPESARLARWRMTNLDLVAARLQAEAGPEDLIVIHKWFCGVTFNRYYHGQAPWSDGPADGRLPDTALRRAAGADAGKGPFESGGGSGGGHARLGAPAVAGRLVRVQRPAAGPTGAAAGSARLAGGALRGGLGATICVFGGNASGEIGDVRRRRNRVHQPVREPPGLPGPGLAPQRLIGRGLGRAAGPVNLAGMALSGAPGSGDMLRTDVRRIKQRFASVAPNGPALPRLDFGGADDPVCGRRPGASAGDAFGA